MPKAVHVNFETIKIAEFDIKVSPEDVERLLALKWKCCRHQSGGLPQITSVCPTTGRTRTILRLIMNPPEGMVVTRIDRANWFDLRRSNLRVCAPADAVTSVRGLSPDVKTSIYKGVYFDKKAGAWRAMINPNRSRIDLGLHLSEADAARAYDRAARIYYGEFAYQNLSDQSDASNQKTSLALGR